MAESVEFVTLTVYVNGRVQGVGFRQFVRRHAATLGLRGWVRNLPDGRVEVVALGRRDAVDALRHFLRQGPPHAQVTGVEEIWSPREDVPVNFVLRA